MRGSSYMPTHRFRFGLPCGELNQIRYIASACGSGSTQ